VRSANFHLFLSSTFQFQLIEITLHTLYKCSHTHRVLSTFIDFAFFLVVDWFPSAAINKQPLRSHAMSQQRVYYDVSRSELYSFAMKCLMLIARLSGSLKICNRICAYSTYRPRHITIHESYQYSISRFPIQIHVSREIFARSAKMNIWN